MVCHWTGANLIKEVYTSLVLPGRPVVVDPAVVCCWVVCLAVVCCWVVSLTVVCCCVVGATVVCCWVVGAAVVCCWVVGLTVVLCWVVIGRVDGTKVWERRKTLDWYFNSWNSGSLVTQQLLAIKKLVIVVITENDNFVRSDYSRIWETAH